MKQLAGKGNMNQRMDAVLYRFRSRMSAYPPGMCPLKMYHSLFQMSMNQSCGKCVPCRDGLVEAEKLLRDIINGDGTNETLDKLQNMCTMIAQTADCAVGVVAAELLLDSFREFPDEYESHINNKSCVKNVVQTVPCVTLCPAHVNVPGYVALIKEGKYDDAVALIRDRNPFPTACAMVCEHPCENKCRRKIIDEAINIRGLKKYAVDNASDSVAVPPSNVSTAATATAALWTAYMKRPSPPPRVLSAAIPPTPARFAAIATTIPKRTQRGTISPFMWKK